MSEVVSVKMSRKPARILVCALLLTGVSTILQPLNVAASATSANKEDQSAADTIPLAKVKAIIAEDQKIVSPHGIQQDLMLHINGIDQWVSIRGRDLRNPVLLVVHGGPGSPEMPAAWTFQSPWEDYFTVVEWSQRGTGKTYAANTEAKMVSGMNVQGMADDGAELVQYLRKRFGKKKIFLMAHSWGTVLGVTLAQQHPDWFYAYISVGQIVNFRHNEEAGYEFALKQARLHKNVIAVQELEAIAPYPGKNLTVDRVGVRSKWEMYYGGLAWDRQDFSWDSDTWKLSPEYNKQDLEAIDKGSLFSLNHLFAPLLSVDFDRTTHFGCPVILFVGAHDYTTSYELTEKWFDRLQAPSKRLVIFSDSAHMIMEEQPGRFLVHLVNDALPYARKVGDSAPAEQTRT